MQTIEQPATNKEAASVAKKTPNWHPYNPHVFGEYDLQQLEQAKKLLSKVYEYHYGDSYMRKELGRLKTVINKLEDLQKISEVNRS